MLYNLDRICKPELKRARKTETETEFALISRVLVASNFLVPLLNNIPNTQWVRATGMWVDIH